MVKSADRTVNVNECLSKLRVYGKDVHCPSIWTSSILFLLLTKLYIYYRYVYAMRRRALDSFNQRHIIKVVSGDEQCLLCAGLKLIGVRVHVWSNRKSIKLKWQFNEQYIMLEKCGYCVLISNLGGSFFQCEPFIIDSRLVTTWRDSLRARATCPCRFNHNQH